LSKLSFSESETTTFATTLSKIVDMVELLNEVDTEGVAITTTMADKKNVMRQDVAEEGTDRALLFKNVPEKENHFIKVPAILDDGGDA
ncbi:Asp-tRNA(Asn)/Glu-tRNA(Gln) amidotransferase subunit GatC, partial [Streptococcus pyogenes]|nr:Asp-tRNA(Asn)/Glu-tRNA(Gln) amidotransferase subunit GatC [Streptococcus pyogenes]